MSGKIAVNLRLPEFMKLVFDLYAADQQVIKGAGTNADVMWQLLLLAAPEHIQRVRDLRPDLWKQLMEDGYPEE